MKRGMERESASAKAIRGGRGSPPAPSRPRPLTLLKAAVWLLCLAPVALLAWDGYTDDLTAEPIKEITHRTGWWALTLLLASLSVTPLRRLTGWNPLIKLRRPLGLFAFFYACLHVLTYFGLDQFFALDYIAEDVLERPYITVGFTAWVLLIPLAVTSTQGWIRRLGKRWQRLHRLVYASAALGVLHFLWAVKADTREPFLFAAALGLLLAFRLPAVQRALSPRKRDRRPPPKLAEVSGDG